MPLFSWRAVAGANIRPLSAVPHLSSSDSSGDQSDRIVVEVRRVVPQPAGRFLAVLYGVSVFPAGDQKSKHQRTPVLSIPSPVVRLWSLKPKYRDGEEESEESDREDKSGTQPKRKRFLKLGNMKNGETSTLNHKLDHKIELDHETDWIDSVMIDYKMMNVLCSCDMMTINLLIRSHQIDIQHINITYQSIRLGLGKGRSCFLSGVSGLLHAKGKKKQKDPYPSTSVSPNIISQYDDIEAELQGPEWSIIKHMTIGSDDSSTLAGTKQKESLMAVLVSRGLVSESDLAEYQSAVSAYGGVTHSKSISSESKRRRSRLGMLNSDAPIGLIPAVIDGPYLCKSLNHRAPVVELLWRDDGPTFDAVFIPAVVCSLTMDNCITVWLESSSDVSLFCGSI